MPPGVSIGITHEDMTIVDISGEVSTSCVGPNFMRTLAMPKTPQIWSLTSLRGKPIKIGAKVVSPRALRDLAGVVVWSQMFAGRSSR